LLNFGVVIAGMVMLWLLSIAIHDVSFIDAVWGVGFVAIALVSWTVADGDPTRQALLVAITAAWGLRLGGYLFWRWRRTGPDPRYVAMQRRAAEPVHWFTVRKVFLLQGALMWVVSLPVQLGQWYRHPAGWTVTAVIGVAVCAVGLFFESVADWQLVRFKAQPANAGVVLDRGLWRYTRHPNYFGDCCMWWGLFLIAVCNPVTAVGVIGPLAMTFLLLKWSGVTVLERRLHRHRPGYADYVQRTSAFIPLPPKRLPKRAPVAR
jgi:steroid 5-alpha reductase family enzyme